MDQFRFQVGLLTTYIVHNEPFLMIREGHTAQDEDEKVLETWIKAHVDSEVVCFCVVDPDNFIMDILDVNSVNLLKNGSAILCQADNPPPPMTDEGHLLQFFSDLLFDDKETGLLSGFVDALAKFLDGNLDPVDEVEKDGRTWREIRQAQHDMLCADELCECVDYVRRTGYPLLLWYFPENNGEQNDRLILRKVEHWIVPAYGSRRANR